MSELTQSEAQAIKKACITTISLSIEVIQKNYQDMDFENAKQKEDMQMQLQNAQNICFAYINQLLNTTFE